MTEQECLNRMVPPGARRAGKYREGVIQIWVTRACDRACYGCTQGSNLAGNPGMITPAQFEAAVVSLKGYFGVVGMFGGNPAIHPKFRQLCEIMRAHIPWEQRGVWSNNPITPSNAAHMRETFNPAVSNLNVHQDQEAFRLFREYWPEARVVGLFEDSRHAPVHLAMKDVLQDEAERWRLIANCDINQHWSAMVGVFRGELRAWFCEVAGAQSMLHQHEPDYPDTGYDPTEKWTTADGQRDLMWWQLPMRSYTNQVRKHCHECAVPLRGYGELANAEGPAEQTSETHRAVFRPKVPGRSVELVTTLAQLHQGRIEKVNNYLGNSSR